MQDVPAVALCDETDIDLRARRGGGAVLHAPDAGGASWSGGHPRCDPEPEPVRRPRLARAPDVGCDRHAAARESTTRAAGLRRAADRDREPPPRDGLLGGGSGAVGARARGARARDDRSRLLPRDKEPVRAPRRRRVPASRSSRRWRSACAGRRTTSAAYGGESSWRCCGHDAVGAKDPSAERFARAVEALAIRTWRRPPLRRDDHGGFAGSRCSPTSGDSMDKLIAARRGLLRAKAEGATGRGEARWCARRGCRRNAAALRAGLLPIRGSPTVSRRSSRASRHELDGSSRRAQGPAAQRARECKRMRQTARELGLTAVATLLSGRRGRGRDGELRRAAARRQRGRGVRDPRPGHLRRDGRPQDATIAQSA